MINLIKDAMIIVEKWFSDLRNVLLIVALVFALVTMADLQTFKVEVATMNSELDDAITRNKQLVEQVDKRVDLVVSEYELLEKQNAEEKRLSEEKMINDIALVVMAESGNQSFRGKYLVACTIVNRSKKYNKSFDEIIYQPGQYAKPYVFKTGLSTWQKEQESLMFNECVEAVKMALEETEPVMYFCNPKTSTKAGFEWIEENAILYCVEQDHNFYIEE